MKKGFTLMELLVVISIIAVLSTIGLITFQGASSKTRDGIRKNDLRTLATALEIYYQKNSKYVVNAGKCQDNTAGTALYTDADFAKLISGSLPKDPKSKNPYCYESDSNTYRLYAKLEDGSNYILTSEDYIASQSQPPPQNQPPPPAATPPPPAAPALPTLRVFVTSATYTGNLGRLFGADQKCQQAADAVSSLQGKLWRAWLSDSNTSAKDRISDGRYIKVDGTVIANNKTDLLDGNLLVPVSVTETGGTPSIYGTESNPYVWTGTDASGNATSYTCANWDQPQTTSGTLGLANQKDSRWTNGAVGNDPQCQTYQRHLYCFEQPAPSSTGGPGCLTAYRDFDNDGYTVNSPVYFCNITTLPYGYRSSPSAQSDCYDQNPNAKPGQTGYFDIDRGDGSFDYNCDGNINTNPNWPKVGVSCGLYPVSTNSNCSNSFSNQACYTTGIATTTNDCGKDSSYTDSSPTMYQDDESGCLLTLGNRYKGKLACR